METRSSERVACPPLPPSLPFFALLRGIFRFARCGGRLAFGAARVLVAVQRLRCGARFEDSVIARGIGWRFECVKRDEWCEISRGSKMGLVYF